MNPSGNGNGGYSACGNGSYYADGIDARPSFYPDSSPDPCWMFTGNWVNGQTYMGKPTTTPGYPGWIHGVTWGPPSSDMPPVGGAVKVALPAAAAQVVAEAGPRKGATRAARLGREQ